MTVAGNHTALRVTDIDVAIAFYTDIFGGDLVTRPFYVAEDAAARIFEVRDGTRVRMCQLRFDDGVFELFEIPAAGPSPKTYEVRRSNLLHSGLVVEDVEDCVRKVMEAGGRIVSPCRVWGRHRIAFVADLDGNVLELTDSPIEALIESTLAENPEARPQG